MGKGIILTATVLMIVSCSVEKPRQEAAENAIAPVSAESEAEQLKTALEKLSASSVTVSGTAGNVRIETDGKTTRTIPKEKLEIGGTGVKKRASCNGEHVIIDGMGNELTLSGRAGYLEVSGSDQTVFIEAANQIEVSGNNNKIYWEKEVGGKVPQVRDAGSGNVIKQKG